MPYYIKQRITQQIINVFMIIVLIVTLFPIGWMIYCSFKNNTEILLGKIPIGRAANDVLLTQPENNDLWVLTSDGGIHKYNQKDYNLENYTSLRTSATSYMLDQKYIWVSSSNKGLVQVDKTDLKNIKHFPLPEIAKLDRNKIVSTSIVKDKNHIWISLYYRGFEKLLKFDAFAQRFLPEINLSGDASPLQVICLANSPDILWIGTDKGLLKFDKEKNSVAKSCISTDLGLQSLPINNISFKAGDLFLGTATGLYEISANTLKLKRHYLESDKIISTYINEKNIYAGTNTGLIIINKVTGKNKPFEALFKFHPDKKELEPGTVFSINKISNTLWLGSSNGRFSIFNIARTQTVDTLTGKEGYLKIMFSNYIDLWKNINFGLYLRNSLLICGITMLVAMIFATFAAYALARFNFPGSKFFSISILATQMIPAIMLLIPIYIMFVKFTEFTGIPFKGTFAGLIIIYSAFFIPFSIWILRGFFAAIPTELEEAARIDGCSQIQVFWYIALPLAIPGIIATGIYVFLTAWDELMFAWVLTNADTITVPVGIRYFVGNYQNRFDLMMAAATVATVPVIILFFLLQRHIVKGLTAGAVKG